MAASLFDALGWDDLLSKHNMKSWQESVRSFSVAVMTTATIVLLYKSDQNVVNCIPINETMATNYREPDAAFANNICAYQGRWFFSNVSWLCMLATGLVFVADNYWLLVPSVGATIIKVDEICKLSLEIDGSMHLPYGVALDPRQMRNSLRELWKLLSYFKPHEMFLCLKKRTVSSDSVSFIQEPNHRSHPDQEDQHQSLVSIQESALENESSVEETKKQKETLCEAETEAEEGKESNILSQINCKRRRALDRQNEDTKESVDLLQKAEGDGYLTKRNKFVKKYFARNCLSTLLSTVCFIAMTVGIASESWYTRVSVDCFVVQQNTRYQCVYTSHDFVLPAVLIFTVAAAGQVVSVVMVMVRSRNKDDLELLLDMKHGTADHEKLESFRDMVRNDIWPAKLLATADILLLHAIKEGDLDFVKFYDFISRGNLTRALTSLRFTNEDEIDVYETVIHQHLAHKPDIPSAEELRAIHRFRMRKRK